MVRPVLTERINAARAERNMSAQETRDESSESYTLYWESAILTCISFTGIVISRSDSE